MRHVTFGGANSLDNFIARPDDGVDWLLWCNEAAQVMAEFWPTIDTVVMGRKTYDVQRRMSENGVSPEGDYSGVRTYVFSRTLPEGTHGGATIVREDAADFVRRLKAQDGKGICVMGGGELARSLFEAGLICRADDRGDPVVQLSPPLICGPEQFEQIESTLRTVLSEAVFAAYHRTVELGEQMEAQVEAQAAATGRRGKYANPDG